MPAAKTPVKPRRLPALEANILKYRAVQMVLVLHEFESLKRFIVGSMRSRLPVGIKRPFESALDILISEAVIEAHEKAHLVELGSFRNRIGHQIHSLVADVSTEEWRSGRPCLHDYWILTKLEALRTKIELGMRGKLEMQLSFDAVDFGQAERAYKEELERLDRKINRHSRASEAAPSQGAACSVTRRWAVMMIIMMMFRPTAEAGGLS